MIEPDPIFDKGDDSGAEESWLGTDWVLFDNGDRTPRCTPDAGTGPSHTAGHEGTFPAQTTSRGASTDYEDPVRTYVFLMLRTYVMILCNWLIF